MQQTRTQTLPETSAVTVDAHFCGEHNAIAASDTSLPYTDTAHGLAMQIPYASGWTDARGGKLAPYLQLQNGIAFGPFVYGSADHGKTCTAVRAYTLMFAPPRSATETQKTVATGATITTIGTLSAVSWTINTGVCSVPALEVSGQTANEILSMSCAALGTSHAHDVQTLEHIAASIRTP